MNNKNFLIVAGGTGGHIFPAIVFGHNLEKSGANVKWLCGSRKLEAEIYNSSGIQPLLLSLSGSPLGTKSFPKIFARLNDLARSFHEASCYIKTFMPDEIYLFGGYISFAPLMIALLRKIPVTLHEQNAVAGKVTRIASRLGAKIVTGWPNCEGIKNFTYTGIPVREPVRIPKHDALKTLGLDIPDNARIVGVAGGSLGSGSLSRILTEAANMCENFEFIFLSSHERKDDGNKHFILSQWNMNAFYSVCDILVCRAGGSTLAEALKWDLPTISIPWPGAADNHQEKNAAEFVKLAKNSRIFREDDRPEKLADIISHMR